MERMYTEQDVTRLVDAALLRLKLSRPVPSTLTFPQAAEMMDLSESTIRRLKPPRVGGKIPAWWVLKQLEG